MRSGFNVCAAACKCQTLLPKKLPWPRTLSVSVATLSSLATSAVYSNTSPLFRGRAGAAGGAFFLVFVVVPGLAGTGGGRGFPNIPSSNLGGYGGTTAGRGNTWS